MVASSPFIFLNHMLSSFVSLVYEADFYFLHITQFKPLFCNHRLMRPEV